MNTPQSSQPNPVLEAFGKAAGVLASLVLTLPANEALHPIFAKYALSYASYQHTQYLWLFDLIFLMCVFFFIFSSVWFLIVMGFKFITKLTTVLFKGVMFGLFFIFSAIFRR